MSTIEEIRRTRLGVPDLVEPSAGGNSVAAIHRRQYGNDGAIGTAIREQQELMAQVLRRHSAGQAAATMDLERARVDVERQKLELEQAKAEAELRALRAQLAQSAPENGALTALVSHLAESQRAEAERTANLHAQLLSQVQSQVGAQVEALKAEVAKSGRNEDSRPPLAGIIGQVQELRQLAELILPGAGGRSVDETVALARLESERAVQLQRLQLDAEDRTERRRLEEAKIAVEQARASKLGDLVENLAPGVLAAFSQHVLPHMAGSGAGGVGGPEPGARPESAPGAGGDAEVSCPHCALRISIPPDLQFAACPRCKGTFQVRRDEPTLGPGQRGGLVCQQCGGPGLLAADGRTATCAECGASSAVRWADA